MENKRLEELLASAPSLELAAHQLGVTTAAVDVWRKAGQTTPFAAMMLADIYGDPFIDPPLLSPQTKNWPSYVEGGKVNDPEC